MGAFSCLGGCGGKKAQRLDSPESARPVPIPSQNEKTVALPVKVLNEFSFVRKEQADDAMAKPGKEPLQAAPTIGELSSFAEFKLDLLPTPAVEAASSSDPFADFRADEARTTSPKGPTAPTHAHSPVPRPVRSVSSASSQSRSGSRGSTLQLVSTKASTPSRTPTEGQAKPFPTIRTSSPEQQNESLATAESASAIDVFQELLPMPASHKLPSASYPLDLKAIEAFSKLQAMQSPSPPARPVAPSTEDPNPPTMPPKHAAPLTTTNLLPQLRHRPSYEDDSPITPSNRPSPAPAEPATTNKQKADKHKGLLSRLLSTSTKKDSKPSPPNQTTTLPNTTTHDINPGRAKELALDPVREERESDARVEKLEGRKWRDEGDNESLFCY